MDQKPVFTTGDVASHCHVSQETVANWIRSGRLKAYATPGRHRRISLGDLSDFLVEHGMPPLVPSSPPPSPRRILVVDDDPAFVNLVVRLLARDGRYETATAADGFEAGIQIVRYQPDLVILDLMMPNLDGFKVCASIRSTAETQNLLVLVVTGYADEGNLQRALQAGADRCMTKPLSVHSLARELDELFESRRTAASHPAPA